MMARVAKFKRTDLVPVLRDLYRELKEYRSTVVDTSRTGLNYTYGCQTWNEAKSKALERELEIMNGKIIKQSRPLCSWLVKYPTGNVSVSERDFFEAVHDYMVQTYGEANVIAVCVHMDETRPHCHCLIVPEVTSRKTGERTVSTASLLDRAHLQKFHKEFDEFMYERFGERNLITLPEEDKQEENVSIKERRKYNELLREHNELLKEHNELLKKYKKLLEEHNELLTEYRDNLKEQVEQLSIFNKELETELGTPTE